MEIVQGILNNFGINMEPAPAVQALIYIPRLKYTDWIDLLIDTGASNSTINGSFALDLQDKMRPQTIRKSRSVGGIVNYYHENAVLIFRNSDGHQFGQHVSMGVQQFNDIQYVNDPNYLDCPCILGRDVLKRCRFVYNAKENDNPVTLTFWP